MMLAKVKEQNGMMLAKVKEQDGIMLANVKVPSIATSAACCDDMQLTNAKSSPCTFYNRQLLNRTVSSETQIHVPLFIYNHQLLHRTASSKTQIPLVIYNIIVNYFIGLRPPNTDTSSYLQLSTTYFIGLRPPKHRYLSLAIYNRQLLHRTASSFKPLIRDTWDFYICKHYSILFLHFCKQHIPSCSFTFASIIPSCSFKFASIIPSCSRFTFASVIPTL